MKNKKQIEYDENIGTTEEDLTSDNLRDLGISLENIKDLEENS